ncbi:MAG TPA: type VI secretion system tip protein TssI/VgrG [Bryobacteraceae bacterium]|nr:type VI secretion system tip protein TssI/VgrG [Bryobacteraceae bacterium]
MPTYTQDNRIVAIETPLGDNVLLLEKVNGHESVSRIFTYHVDLLSEKSDVTFDDIVGQRVTVTIHLANDEKRYINGFVSRFVQSGKDNRFAHYQAEIVPWMWFLTRNVNCRIFQNKSVVDIITQIFRDLGFQDFKNSTQGSYDSLEYCVQYRETDFNFVSRLMEQYGIFYFFQHELSKHTLVLADSPSSFDPCPNQPTARFETMGRVTDEARITAFQIGHELRSGQYALNDYNFKTPLTDLDVTEPTLYKVANNTAFEIYDYPGDYLNKGSGETVAKVRMQEEESGHEVGHGVSNCAGFIAGYRFDLQEHYRSDLNKTYVLMEVQHFANCGAAYQTTAADEEDLYTNHFTVIPKTVDYRPMRITPRPIVQGPQTAVVVGPGGEEIYVDEFGRVKVQFFWDREGKANENSSCWIRVSQLWAGKKWGAMWIPRIGQEVIVDFLEGDPDRPIITGRVYNADQMPPYTLPDQKTKSTIKSYSSKGGGGFNEIRFEDKKGSEQIFINAQKNQDIRVGADHMESIGHDTHLTVEHDQKEKVKGDKHLQVTGDHNQKVDGTESLKVGQDMQEKIGSKYSMDAGQEIQLKAGTNWVGESGSMLTLKVGGNFININSAGIFISGTMVMINSGGAAGSGAGCNPETPLDPLAADSADPGQMGTPITMQPRSASGSPASFGPQALVLKAASQSGAPFCDI